MNDIRKPPTMGALALADTPEALEAVAAQRPRRIRRLYPVGVKDRPAVLIAVCEDDTIWELDRSGPYERWHQLPSIPGYPPDDTPY